MSDVANLNIVIGANVSQATQGLETVSKSLANTAVAASKVDSSLVSSGKSSNSAAIALQNLGRVAQDAPFGFIAIQNNLNPLLESFQRLKAESGSNVTALRSLIGSFAGPAGLGVALSLVSSAIVFFTQRSRQNKEAVDEQKKALDGLESSIAKDIFNLNVLNSIITDKSNPYTIRENALKKFREQYEPYLKNLSDEAILNGQDAEAIKQINDALLAKLTLQAGEGKIVELLKQRLDVQLKLNESLKTQSTSTSFVADLKGATGNAQALGVQLQAAVKNALPKNKEYEKSIGDINVKIQALFNTLRDSINNSAGLDFGKSAIVKVKKDAKDVNDVLVDLNSNIEKIPKQFINAIAVETGDALNSLAGIGKEIPLTGSILPPTGDIKDSAKDLEKMANITKTVKDAFDSLFNSIANGANVFDAIGQALKQLIVKLIATVIEAALLSVILNAVFPGSASASKGLFSFSHLFNQLSGLPKFAAGGVVTKPTLALVGEQGPERITPLGYENNVSGLNGRVVFEIAGNKLRGVLRREDLNSSFIN